MRPFGCELKVVERLISATWAGDIFCRPFRAWIGRGDGYTGVALALHPGLWSASPSGFTRVRVSEYENCIELHELLRGFMRGRVSEYKNCIELHELRPFGCELKVVERLISATWAGDIFCRPFRAWIGRGDGYTGVALALHPGLWSASPSGFTWGQDERI